MSIAILSVIIAVNIASFVVYGYDKYSAVSNNRRVPEKTLLALALLGGGVGAVIAQSTFRHKTRKLLFKLAGILGAGITIGLYVVLVAVLP